MSDDEPLAHQLQAALWDVIQQFRAGHLLTYAETIGALECIKHDLFTEMDEEDT